MNALHNGRADILCMVYMEVNLLDVCALVRHYT